MAPLNSCCCCIPLRTGVKVMSILCLLGIAYSLYSMIGQLASGQQNLNATLNALEDLMKKKEIPFIKYDRDQILSISYYMSIFDTIFYILWIPVAILLFLGAMKDRAEYLLPYLVYSPVVAIFHLIFWLVICVLIHANVYFYGIYFGAAVISGLITLYFVLVVYSLYKELREIHGDSNIGFFKM